MYICIPVYNGDNDAGDGRTRTYIYIIYVLKDYVAVKTRARRIIFNTVYVYRYPGPARYQWREAKGELTTRL